MTVRLPPTAASLDRARVAPATAPATLMLSAVIAPEAPMSVAPESAPAMMRAPPRVSEPEPRKLNAGFTEAWPNEIAGDPPPTMLRRWLVPSPMVKSPEPKLRSKFARESASESVVWTACAGPPELEIARIFVIVVMRGVS